MAPALKIVNMSIGLDNHKSDIKITGGLVDWFLDKFVGLFNSLIFSEITKQASGIITNLVNTSINDDLKEYGTHIAFDGIGFDFALTKDPVVSQDQMATLFLNGTFFDDMSQQAGVVTPTVHPSFEIGKMSRQDVMVHIQKSSVASLITNIFGSPEGLNVTGIIGSPPFNLQFPTSDLFYLNQKIAKSKYAEDPAEVALFMRNIKNMTLNNSQAAVCGELGFVVSTNGILLSNFSLEGFCANLGIESRPKYAQLILHLNEL